MLSSATRQILVAVALAMLLVAAALGLTYRQIAIGHLTERGTREHQTTAYLLAHTLWPEVDGFMRGSRGISAAALAQHPGLAALHSRVEVELAHVPGVVRLKAYDLAGRVIYSTEAAQIGEDRAGSTGFQTARAGGVASELIRRGQFSTLERNVFDRNLLTSYVPVQRRGQVPVEGVLEIYSDVTPLIDGVTRMAWFLAAAAALGQMLVYGVLAVLLWRTERRAASAAQGEVTAQARAQAALERLQIIADGVPGLIADFDTTLHLTYCNQPYAHWFGLAEGAAQRPHLSDVAGAVAFREVEHHFARALAGEYVEYERPHSRAAGGNGFIEVRLQPSRDAAGVIDGVYALSSDTTARKHAELAIAESEARFRALTGLSSDWYWEQDQDFRFTRIDGPRTQPLIAVAPDQMIGKTRWELEALNLTPDDWLRHRALLEGHQPFRDFRIKRTSPAGEVRWQSISGDPVFDARGRFTGYRGVGKDVSARVRDEEHIVHLAYHDILTGLPNRSMVQDRITQAVALAQRGEHSAAVLFLDLDHFKPINDSLGHAAGDAVLRECAQRLRECLRDADTLGRFGGDEFLVLLPRIHGPADAAHVASKLVEALRAPFMAGAEEVRIGVSVGIAMTPADGADAATLIRNADAAMYHAKQAGRNHHRFFTTHDNADASRRLSLETDLRRGLERGEFSLAYQPQIDLASGAVTGIEALLRWQRADGRDSVGPAVFIPVCEDIGLIHELGGWALREACRQTAAWVRAGLAPGRIAVNVSARQIHSGGFAASVRAALEESALPATLLELEITESLTLDRHDETIAILDQLHGLGVTLAMDDFGTGYSSLATLKRFPVDVIKIDQSFVRDMHLDKEDAAMVQAIVALAHALSMSVIAEGVEHAAQADALRAMGCGIAQGYHFAHPLDAHALGAYLTSAQSAAGHRAAGPRQTAQQTAQDRAVMR